MTYPDCFVPSITDYIGYYEDCMSEDVCDKIIEHVETQRSSDLKQSTYSSHKGLSEEKQHVLMNEVWFRNGEKFYDSFKLSFNNVINNYWSDEHTKENFVDGWLKTGDLGKIDDGYLYILGRVDDLINISGEKVYPQEIERVVKVLTGIDDVIAVPMKHEVFGEVVKLFVKKSIESNISKTDILTHCIKNLERFKVPAKIEFVEDFPRTDYGKIKRFMLK